MPKGQTRPIHATMRAPTPLKPAFQMFDWAFFFKLRWYSRFNEIILSQRLLHRPGRQMSLLATQLPYLLQVLYQVQPGDPSML
jgi:hypothetical protein